jgi:hypothetical protein
MNIPAQWVHQRKIRFSRHSGLVFDVSETLQRSVVLLSKGNRKQLLARYQLVRAITVVLAQMRNQDDTGNLYNLLILATADVIGIAEPAYLFLQRPGDARELFDHKAFGRKRKESHQL